MNLTINITSQICHCRQAWDNLLPVDHHLKSRHLLAFEQSGIEDIQNNYVQVFKEKELIGLLYLQQFQFGFKHLNFRKDQAAIARFIKLVLPSRLPILVCGHLFRINFQGFYFKNTLDQAYLFDAIKLFIRQQKQRPCGIMIKDCSDDFIEQKCSLSGYSFFNGDVTMELQRRPHWLSFNDYLNDLKKDYFKRAKKILAAFENIEDRELTTEAIKAQSAQIERLYWNVVDKQSVKLGTINTSYFYELKKNLQQNFEFHALYQRESMVGFYTFIFYEGEMETHYIGIDYEANKTAKIYFNILFAGIKKMIERKDAKLELGRTAREAKANLGAVPRQVFNYVKAGNPFIRLALDHFLKRFNSAENKSLTNRNPLK